MTFTGFLSISPATKVFWCPWHCVISVWILTQPDSTRALAPPASLILGLCRWPTASGSTEPWDSHACVIWKYRPGEMTVVIRFEKFWSPSSLIPEWMAWDTVIYLPFTVKFCVIEAQILFFLLPPWNGDVMAAKAPFHLTLWGLRMKAI